MTKEILMMENTALRMELKKVMEENERLRTILAVKEVITKNSLEKYLADIVVNEYHKGKKVKDSIEKIKAGLLTESRLEAMINEFLNPSQEQIDAEVIFKERGIFNE